MKTELILAVEANKIEKALVDGVIPTTREEFLSLLVNNLWLGPRYSLETNENFKQLIPYSVIMCDNKILRYTRTTKSGEKRLVGANSIGFGGHIEISDVQVDEEQKLDVEKIIYNAAWRELQEEIYIEGDLCPPVTVIGTIYEGLSSVGRVHIGILLLWRIENLPTISPEEGLSSFELCSLEQLKEDTSLEVWSNYVVNFLSANEAILKLL